MPAQKTLTYTERQKEPLCKSCFSEQWVPCLGSWVDTSSCIGSNGDSCHWWWTLVFPKNSGYPSHQGHRICQSPSVCGNKISVYLFFATMGLVVKSEMFTFKLTYTFSQDQNVLHEFIHPCCITGSVKKKRCFEIGVNRMV